MSQVVATISHNPTPPFIAEVPYEWLLVYLLTSVSGARPDADASITAKWRPELENLSKDAKQDFLVQKLRKALRKYAETCSLRTPVNEVAEIKTAICILRTRADLKTPFNLSDSQIAELIIGKSPTCEQPLEAGLALN